MAERDICKFSRAHLSVSGNENEAQEVDTCRFWCVFLVLECAVVNVDTSRASLYPDFSCGTKNPKTAD